MASLLSPMVATCVGCRTIWDYLRNIALGIVIATVLVVVAAWWTGRRGARPGRQSRRARTGQRQKPISDSMAARGFSLVVDELSEGGYSAWSTDSADLRVEAPTLVEMDEKVRQCIRDRLVDKENRELSVAYVWHDSAAAIPTAAGGQPADKSSRPPKSVYLEVRQVPGNGYIAEGEPDLRVTAQTLDRLAPAARAAIAGRWPNAGTRAVPVVTFAWVRSVRM
jgi:hypothetical protein